MATVKYKVDLKAPSYVTSNPGKILELNEPIWLSDGTFSFGDGVTTLNNLVFYGGSSGLDVGTTAITNGTNGYILYNNNGVLGNLATTGSGSVVLATSPTLTTLLTVNGRIIQNTVATTGTNGYGAYFNATTGATNNYAAGFGGDVNIVTGTISLSGIVIRALVGTTNYGALYIGVTPSATNYSLISEGTNLVLNAPVSGGSLSLRVGNANNLVITTSTLTVSDSTNFVFNTSIGSKIMTSNLQKGAFWGATPIVQPTTAVAAATFVVSAGTAVNDASTFDGYTIKQIVKALRNTGLLA